MNTYTKKQIIKAANLAGIAEKDAALIVSRLDEVVISEIPKCRFCGDEMEDTGFGWRECRRCTDAVLDFMKK